MRLPPRWWQVSGVERPVTRKCPGRAGGRRRPRQARGAPGGWAQTGRDVLPRAPPTAPAYLPIGGRG